MSQNIILNKEYFKNVLRTFKNSNEIYFLLDFKNLTKNKKIKKQMKLPKKTKRFCPKCNERTEQKIGLVSIGHKRGSLKRGSLIRAKKRGAMPGKGNKGRYGSKPAIKSWKRKTKSTTRKVIIYLCKKCGKSRHAKKSRRVSKILIE